MSIDNRNFLELCNEILDELYYEEVSDFDELQEIQEGRRVKRELNRALTFICNNEDTAWSFKDTDCVMVPVDGVSMYDLPDGYIEYMKYKHNQLVLQYYEDHRNYPSNAVGLPTGYWIEDSKIRLYPTPMNTGNDKEIVIHYYTNGYAKDCCGMTKPVMEYATDTPIIPNKHRDILIWRVCADWRANNNDAKTQFYEDKFKKAYKAMLSDCRITEDYPNGNSILGGVSSYSEALLKIFRNPYINSSYKERNM